MHYLAYSCKYVNRPVLQLIRTAILGASGYVGGELLRLLVAHPQLRATKLFGESKAGQPVAETHPHLASVYPGSFERFDGAALADVDIVFAALPHGHSQALAPLILDRGIPFVDLGADFRLDDAETYERSVRPHSQGPFPARRVRLRHSRAQPRGDPWCKGGSRRRMLRHRRDPCVEASGGQRTHRSEEPDRRRCFRSRAARGARRRRQPASARSTAASRPMGCSTTATPLKWKWRWTRRCCSRPISYR